MSTHREKWNCIRGLDLEKIRLKWLLKYQGSLRFWQFCKKRNAADYAMQLQHEYRQFLFLCAANPNQVIVPWSEDLDEFWHTHLLHTEKYANDCDKVFGRVLRHTPLDPCQVRPSSHLDNYRETKRLYAKTFGAPGASGCGSANFVRDTYDSYDPLTTFLVLDAVMDEQPTSTHYHYGSDVAAESQSFSCEAPDPGPAPDGDSGGASCGGDSGDSGGASCGGDSGGASCGGDSGGASCGGSSCGSSCGGGCGGD